MMIESACFFSQWVGAQEVNQQETNFSERFKLATWGEIHFNSGEGGAPDLIDLHRVALLLNYTVNDWIRLNSETTLEHALVSDDPGDGSLTMTQLNVELRIFSIFNLRLGRQLLPIGILNRKHQPTLFYSVERADFDTLIVPTTWHADGAGIFGQLTQHLAYEVVFTNGLDGSKINSVDGISQAVQRETPGFSEPAVTTHLDFVAIDLAAQKLRLGGSWLRTGLDNGNAGINPGNNASLMLYQGDYEYRLHGFEARGAVAYTTIDNALSLVGNSADEIFGWYFEFAWHVWPSFFRQGKLANSDNVLFFRHEDTDTQFSVPAPRTEDPRGQRDNWTFGMAFYPLPQLVFKVDYQLRDDQSVGGLANQFDLGLGWAL